MAVNVIEQPGRDGSYSAQGIRTYTRNFQATTDNPLIGFRNVVAALPVAIRQVYTNGLPSSDPNYETDAWSFCQTITGSCVSDDGLTWMVRAEFAPFDLSQSQDENPLDAPPELNWGGADFEQIVEQDMDGNAILNTAGDPFDPPVTRDGSRTVLTVSRNEATYDPQLAQSFRNRTNTETFFGHEAGCALCKKVDGTRAYHPAYGVYYKVDYEFHFDDDGFDKPILNAGLRQKGTDGKLAAILSKEGQPVTQAVLLDSNGAQLTSGGTPVYLTPKLYEQVDYSNFDFPGA